MADNLEDFIRNNRDALNASEPREGHMDRFEQKLRRNNRFKGPGLTRSPLMRMAAVLAVGFMLGYLYYSNDPKRMDSYSKENGVTTASLDLSSISPELAEAEAFFGQMLREKMETVKPLAGEDTMVYAAIRAQLESLESDYTDLRKELTGNQTNEQIVNAMIQNYRLRLDLIEHILNLKEEAQKFKNTYQNEDLES